MRITNLKFLRKLNFFLSAAIAMGIAMFLFALLIQPLRMVGVFSGAALLGLSVLLYSRLRKIELDTTGEVLSMKSYHPSEERSPHKHKRLVEVPKYMVTKAVVRRGLLCNKVELRIKNDAQKEVKLSIDMLQIGEKQLNAFVNSLQAVPG